MEARITPTLLLIQLFHLIELLHSKPELVFYLHYSKDKYIHHWTRDDLSRINSTSGKREYAGAETQKRTRHSSKA